LTLYGGEGVGHLPYTSVNVHVVNSQSPENQCSQWTNAENSWSKF